MSKQPDFDKVELLGVEIDAISSNDAITELVRLAVDPETPALYVVKPYVEFLDKAAREPDLKRLLNDAYFALPDGIALTWASAYLYAGKRSFGRFWLTLFQIIAAPERLYWPLPKPFAGINFTWPLLEAAAAAGAKIYLVGKESEDEIQRVANTLRTEIPGITIVGYRHGIDADAHRGEVSQRWVASLADDLRAAHADLILVGMGFPLQEGIISVLAMHLEHGVLIGEGGTFDYERFGGTMKRAPVWVQRIWLEWLWRLILQPRRLRRQIAIPRFIWRIWRARN